MSGKAYNSFVYDLSKKVDRYDFIPEIRLSEKLKISSKEVFFCDWGYVKDKKKSPYFYHNEVLETLWNCPVCDFNFDWKKYKDNGYFKYHLSPYLESSKKEKIFIYLRKRGDVTITFDVIKGNTKANDSDGYLIVKVNPPYAKNGIELLSPRGPIKVEYGSSITVKLRIKPNINHFYPNEYFDLNFYAFDNSRDLFDLEGNVTGQILCGQFGIVSRNCICENWPTIPSVIPGKKFVVYTEDCMKASIAQLKKVGYKPKGDANTHIYKIYKDADGNRINDLGNSYIADFKKAISYLKKSLSEGMPSIVGADYQKGHPGNIDKTTDHFFVIVGMGKDNKGAYFTFFDNAMAASEVLIGGGNNSTHNKLYVDCKNYRLLSIGTAPFAANKEYKDYYITQIRESEKIKK